MEHYGKSRSLKSVTDYTRKESPHGRQEKQEGQGQRESAEGSQTSESRKAETRQAAARAHCARPAKVNGQVEHESSAEQHLSCGSPAAMTLAIRVENTQQGSKKPQLHISCASLKSHPRPLLAASRSARRGGEAKGYSTGYRANPRPNQGTISPG